MTKDTVEGRALKIAAQVMTNAGICRHESALKCRRIEVNPTICDECLRKWLLTKARKELEKESAE